MLILQVEIIVTALQMGVIFAGRYLIRKHEQTHTPTNKEN